MRIPESFRSRKLLIATVIAGMVLAGTMLSVAEARQSPEAIGAKLSALVQDWSGNWSLERLTAWWQRSPDQVLPFVGGTGALAIWTDPPQGTVLRSRVSVNTGDARDSRGIDARIWAPERKAVVDGGVPIIKGLHLPDEPRVLRDLAKGRGQWEKSYVWPRVEAHATEPISLELRITKDEGQWRFLCSYTRVRTEAP